METLDAPFVIWKPPGCRMAISVSSPAMLKVGTTRIKATPIQIVIWTAKMTALKPRGLAQALVLLPVVPSVLLLVLASWRSPVWVLSWLPAGWYPLLPALLQVPQLAVFSVL